MVRLIWQRPGDGASLIEVVGTRRVRISARRLAPAPAFGLWVAAANEVKDDPIPPADAPAASALAAVAAEMFAQLMRAQLEAAAESVAAASASGGGAGEERMRERLTAAVESALRRVGPRAVRRVVLMCVAASRRAAGCPCWRIAAAFWWWMRGTWRRGGSRGGLRQLC